jgi:hypothetical protein
MLPGLINGGTLWGYEFKTGDNFFSNIYLSFNFYFQVVIVKKREIIINTILAGDFITGS